MSFELFMEEDRQKERELLASYDLDVRFFRQLGLKIKQIVPERSCFRLETDKGFFCLKKMTFAYEDLSLMQEMTEHLKRNGFANTFELVKDDKGEVLVSYEGSQYYMTHWLDGRDSDYLNPLDIKEATEALAKFHLASEGFVTELPAEPRKLYGKWKQGFANKRRELQTAREMILTEGRADKVPLLVPYFWDCITKVEEAIRLVDKMDYEKLNTREQSRKGFIHHDFGLYNVLHTFDGNTFIGGLENCAFDVRVHDLGHFIYKLLRRKGWDFDSALDVIGYYDQVYRLEKEDYQALAIYLTLPHDCKQLYRQGLAFDKEIEDPEELERLDPNSEYNSMRADFLERMYLHAGL